MVSMQAVKIGGWCWVFSSIVRMATVSRYLWKMSSLCLCEAKFATRSIRIFIRPAFF